MTRLGEKKKHMIKSKIQVFQENQNGLMVSQMVVDLRMLQHTSNLVTAMLVMMRRISESIGQFAKFLKL